MTSSSSCFCLWPLSSLKRQDRGITKDKQQNSRMLWLCRFSFSLAGRTLLHVSLCSISLGAATVTPQQARILCQTGWRVVLVFKMLPLAHWIGLEHMVQIPSQHGPGICIIQPPPRALLPRSHHSPGISALVGAPLFCKEPLSYVHLFFICWTPT